jgi:hypothetical protein
VINYSWNDIYNLHPFPGHYVKRHKQRRLNTHGRIIVPVPKLCSITKGIFPFLPQEPSQQRKWGKVFNVERALEREGREAGRGSYRKEEDNIRKRKMISEQIERERHLSDHRAGPARQRGSRHPHCGSIQDAPPCDYISKHTAAHQAYGRRLRYLHSSQILKETAADSRSD